MIWFLILTALVVPGATSLPAPFTFIRQEWAPAFADCPTLLATIKLTAKVDGFCITGPASSTPQPFMLSLISVPTGLTNDSELINNIKGVADIGSCTTLIRSIQQGASVHGECVVDPAYVPPTLPGS